MKRAVLLCATSIWMYAPALAQTPDMMERLAANPVSGTVRMMLADRATNMTAAADLMPADKFDFHPTPAQMTFGQLIAHIVQTNEFLCSAIAGAPKPPPTSPTDKDPKDALVKALKDSWDRCSTAMANIKDADVSELISMGPQKAPRGYFMIVLVADWADHYSTQAAYLRLNGILPPTARPPAR